MEDFKIKNGKLFNYTGTKKDIIILMISELF